MTGLSRAQRRALYVLATVDAAYVSNITTHEFGGCVSSRSVHVLIGRGLVENVPATVRAEYRGARLVRITEAGRAALDNEPWVAR